MTAWPWGAFASWIGPHRPFAAVALVAWVPAVVALFRALGPSRGSLVAILGGMLFLPRVHVPIGPFPFDKSVATGAGLILGILLFDLRALRGAGPRWLDLPMALYVLAPLLGLISGVEGAGLDIIDSVAQRALGWGVPYAVGRLYFADPDGPRRVAVGIVLAGLAYIPVCVYEEVAGPDRYLSTLVYGTRYGEGMVERLGGYRPEGFLDNGLQLASWMALAGVTGIWLWIGRGHRARRLPIEVVAPALVLASLSCRGVYGYIILGSGIAAAVLTRALRTRIVLVALAVVPAGYMLARASGTWDGRLLVRAATLAGRPGTVAFRLDAEDDLIGRVLHHDPLFGFGNYVWHAAGLGRWPDGQWLQLLWSGGLVGLGVALVGLYAFPAARGLSLPRGRPGPDQASSPCWALSCWCVLSSVDMLHNTNALTASALVAGAIVANVPGAKPARVSSKPATSGSKPPRLGAVAPIVVTVLVLLVIEALGRLPRPIDPPALPIKAPR